MKQFTTPYYRQSYSEDSREVAEPSLYDCTFYYMLTVGQYDNEIDQTFLYAEYAPSPRTSPGESPPVLPKCTEVHIPMVV